ncbi:hypothetical protein VNO77_15537 [Canavalia gladiata]|uniref:Uncharacterized protein n=1 Tax=Canavalia gladiata TaxID=3824 RepID=A0AAN9LZM9_CANGL
MNGVYSCKSEHTYGSFQSFAHAIYIWTWLWELHVPGKVRRNEDASMLVAVQVWIALFGFYIKCCFKEGRYKYMGLEFAANDIYCFVCCSKFCYDDTQTEMHGGQTLES